MSIPIDEYPRRLERLRTLLRASEMDALLVGTGANLRYFSGCPSPARSTVRPFFCLLPGESDPVFFTHSGHKAEAARFTRIADVRDYSRLSHAPVSLLSEVLREKNLIGNRIGMELGFEKTLDISPLEFQQLACALSETSLVGASEILWQLRRIKSEAEIRCIREACAVTSHAYQSVFSVARGGLTEIELFTCMREGPERGSMGDVFLAIASGIGNYDLVTNRRRSA